MTAPGRAAAVLLLGTLYALTPAAMPAPAAATREPVTSLTPAPSAGVREAQALLLELGLWEGDPDGRADDAFRRAVQAFQRHIGRPPSGELDAETLGALRTRGDAARTARRLDSARAEEAAEAAAAIAAAPDLADHLTPQPGDARADAARDLTPCRTTPTAACLLHEARETAKGISDTELRDWVLLDIAVDLALENGVDAAWPVLRLTADPRSVFGGLRRIALTAAAAGHDDLALRAAMLARGLPREALRTWTAVAETLSHRAPPPERPLADVEAAADALLADTPTAERRAALLSLGRAAQARGDTALAQARVERAAALLTGGGDDLTAVAAAWAAVDRPDRAEALLGGLSAAVDPTPVLVDLAGAHARHGRKDAALATARAVPEARYRAVTLADTAVLLTDAATLREAEAVAAEIDLPFAASFAWARIGDAWRILGDPAAARGALARVGDDTLRVEGLQRLAAAPGLAPAQANALDAEAEALRTAMLDRVARVRLGAQRAERLLAAGDAAGAAAARQAVDDALAVRNPWNRARALVAAAKAVRVAADRKVILPPPATGNR